MATRRDRIEAALKGKVADRPPVSFWRHWPGDDETAESHAAVTLGFHREFDWDFVKVTVEAPTFHLLDWGFKSQVSKDRLLVGGRDVVFSPLNGPEEWGRLKPLDVTRGAYGEHLRCLRLIRKEVGDEIPFIFTLFQPSLIADRIVGRGQLALAARRHPARLKALLEVITETLVAFLRAGMGTGAAGIMYATGTCTYNLWSEAEYREFSFAYDSRILHEAAALGWFNMIHLCGTLPMFDLALEYPVQVFNWDDRVTAPSLGDARARTEATLVGGIERVAVLLRGGPGDVTRQALDAFEQAGRRGFMLSAGCTIPPLASRRNLQAARQSVDQMGA